MLTKEELEQIKENLYRQGEYDYNNRNLIIRIEQELAEMDESNKELKTLIYNVDIAHNGRSPTLGSFIYRLIKYMIENNPDKNN